MTSGRRQENRSTRDAKYVGAMVNRQHRHSLMDVQVSPKLSSELPGRHSVT